MSRRRSPAPRQDGSSIFQRRTLGEQRVRSPSHWRAEERH